MTLAMTKYSLYVVMRYDRLATVRSPRRDLAIDRQPVKREVQSSVPPHAATNRCYMFLELPLFFPYTRDTLGSYGALACNVQPAALFHIALLERFYGGNGYKSTPDCVYAGLVRDQSGMQTRTKFTTRPLAKKLCSPFKKSPCSRWRRKREKERERCFRC